MTLIFDGPGWGTATSTYIWLTKHPFIRDFRRGETVMIDPDDKEMQQIQRHIDNQVCRVVESTRPSRKG